MKEIISNFGHTIGKGKFRSTEYISLCIIVDLVKLIRAKEITRIKDIGRFKYAGKELVGFKPSSTLLNFLSGGTDKLPVPILPSSHMTKIKRLCHQFDDDLLLTLDQLMTYVFEKLRDEGHVEVPHLGRFDWDGKKIIFKIYE